MTNAPISQKKRRKNIVWLAILSAVIAGASQFSRTGAQAPPKDTPPIKKSPTADLERRFADQVQPLLNRFCYGCHGGKKPEAQLDLRQDATVKDIVKNSRHWELVLQRLVAKEMPPEDAPRQPDAAERTAMISWLRDLLANEAERHAGDPGIVLTRRLSNAEYDCTIRDLTGVDIRPTREFPVDPANEAGFDNTGESLSMSPALFKKYLAAARQVADHVVLIPPTPTAPKDDPDWKRPGGSEGFVFAQYPAVTETDRDKYCVQRIIDFYKRHQVDYADYFEAAWKFRHREALGQPKAELNQFARNAGLSPIYLSMLWSALTGTEGDTGPLGAIRQSWRELPAPPNAAIRPAAEKMRDLAVRLRKQLKPDIKKLSVSGISAGSQPMVLWRNRELATYHRKYAGNVVADLKKLAEQVKKEAGLAKFFVLDGDGKKSRDALEQFCSAFPAAFAVTDRGPYFNPNEADRGRPLTAGFHLMQGFFRDDQPLCEWILNPTERAELDRLWHELNFVTLAPLRQFKDFIFFERAEPPRFMFEVDFDFARSEDKDCTSEAKMARLAKVYLAKARKNGASNDAAKAIETYFANISADIRAIEKARLDAEPSHLDALLKFCERAYRRPLTTVQRDGVLSFYKKIRKEDDLGHEDAVRDTLASVLLSPQFSYRVVQAEPGTKVQPLDDFELASRLSYFLWSSMPDAELLSHAATGDLRKPAVLKAQTRRMLRDPKIRGVATEFAGNWLDIRRFEEHNAVDRQRFPSFTNELRQAMYEEPLRYFVDVVQRDRSVLDVLYGKDTFVNRTLAKHYGIPDAAVASLATPNDWCQVADASPYGRGGMLPMAVFLTKNAPGLRTSPVKRGYWVVRRVLGEQIPAPPPTVPELPKDEAKLGDLTLAQVLSRHRADKACAGCHNRFDAVGLVFEGFGPIGERRAKDLGDRPVETAATFPDGKERRGLDGLRDYLRDKRQDDYIDNLCKKLLGYGLSRGLMLSDRKTLAAMKARLTGDDYRFGGLVEEIVLSQQFLNKRGRDGEPGASARFYPP